MIYVDNDSTYSQLIYIPRDEDFDGATGHTFSLQRKDYVINNNGLVKIHPDGGYDGISGGTISVYVSAATGVTFEHLDVTEDGIYVPTGDTVYTGVTVQVYDGAYQDGYNDGYSSGYTVGFNEGYSSGMTDGYVSGSTDGFEAGYVSGHTDGYNEGFASGSTVGYNSGYTHGYNDGYASGLTEGYTSGFNDGMRAQRELLSAITLTESGNYVRENGWSAVTVNIDTASTYNDGYTAGTEHQKSLLSAITITDPHVHYEDENGWSAITVNVEAPTIGSMSTTIGQNGLYTFVPSAPIDAFERVEVTVEVPQTGATGVLSSETLTRNGLFFPPQGVDGWSSVTVNFDTEPAYSSGYTDGSRDGFNSGYTSGHTEGFASGYTSGYTDGSEYQKSLLAATSFTQNGVFTDQNGWSSVTVNVDTASTFQSGYSSGYTDGYQAGLTGTPTANVITYLYTNYKDGLPKTGSFDMVHAKQSGYNGSYNYYADRSVPYSSITSVLSSDTVAYEVGSGFQIQMTPPTGFSLQITPSGSSANYANGFVYGDGNRVRIKLVSTLNISTLEMYVVSGASAAQFTSYPNWNFECLDYSSDTYINIASTGETPGVYFNWGYFGGNQWNMWFHEGYPTEIGAGSFSGDTIIQSMKLPVSITKIRANAFRGCTNLTGVTGASGITEVYDNAFRSTHLSAFTSSRLSVIGSNAFYGSHIKTLDISPDCLEIGDGAFHNAPYLRQIRCYASVPPRIGANTFTDAGYANVGTNHLCVPSASVADYQREWGPYLPSNWSFSVM